MLTRLLIDAIVRQTTVLLAQLSTAAGIRAPLSHVADEVFVSLAREIEAQGVGRKVAADMFGLALRTYQKKVQRLTEAATEPTRTLWEAVLDFVAESGPVTRKDVLSRFTRDSEREVIGVLTDLVGTGLLHASGRGTTAVYGATTDAERRVFADADGASGVAGLAWSAIRDNPGIAVGGLAAELRVDLDTATGAVTRLVRDGVVQRDSDAAEAPLRAEPLVLPVGSEMGWEAAVLDHFRAVANAIAAKVRSDNAHSASDDVVGGGTLSFLLTEGHPHEARVRGLLARIRAEVNAVWADVEAFNVAHGVSPTEGARVWFYFGQYVERDEREAS